MTRRGGMVYAQDRLFAKVSLVNLVVRLFYVRISQIAQKLAEFRRIVLGCLDACQHLPKICASPMLSAPRIAGKTEFAHRRHDSGSGTARYSTLYYVARRGTFAERLGAQETLFMSGDAAGGVPVSENIAPNLKRRSWGASDAPPIM